MAGEHGGRRADACRRLAAYLTGLEARQLADRLEDGASLTQALGAVGQARRAEVRCLLGQGGLGVVDRERTVVVLRAVQVAHEHGSSVETVWTAPGNLAGAGRLTAAVHETVTRARESVVCATFNFQRSSVLWRALAEVSRRPEVSVRIYLDTAAADREPAAWKPTTEDVAREMAGATVLRTGSWQGVPVRTHAKFVAVDHRFLLVTSANFSKSAEVHNVELGLVLDDPLVTEGVERQMAALEPHVYEVVRRH